MFNINNGKFGLVTKEEVYLCDHYCDKLYELGISDKEHEKYVVVELYPKDKISYWSNPSEWEYIEELNECAVWFDENKRIETKVKFKKMIEDWCNKHILYNMNITLLENGYYIIKDCTVNEVKNCVVNCINSYIKNIDCSHVHIMSGDSVIEETRMSYIELMTNNSKINKLYGRSFVGMICDDSEILEIGRLSIVREKYFNYENKNGINILFDY